jgi:membrane protein YdbS with pleckstrin-like domain
MSPSSTPLAAFTIRPTSKFVIFTYVATIALTAVAAGVWHQKQAKPEYLYLILGLGALGLFSAIKRHIRLQFTSLSYDGHGLKYQDGMMSKSTRMLNMAKIQDVRVDQGVFDRILGIGTITFETAGESGQLVMENVDQPQEVAHRILQLAKGAI